MRRAVTIPATSKNKASKQLIKNSLMESVAQSAKATQEQFCFNNFYFVFH